jgi:GR25 family glycosyltransferase involved in LPS biosynthesis
MYNGYYVNLDRSPERRIAIEARLSRLDPPRQYARFPAIDGKLHAIDIPGLSDGEAGCLLSHYTLLVGHLDSETHLHVVEDDVVLTKRTVQLLDRAIKAGIFNNYDIVFTDTAVNMDLNWCREAREHYKVSVQRDAHGIASDVTFRLIQYGGCTASYLVNRNSIRLVCEVLGREIDRGAKCPVDLMIHAATADGQLRTCALFPFITSVQPGRFLSTTRRDDTMQQSRFAMEMLRHSFFVDCDLTAALAEAEQWLIDPGADQQERLHRRLAEFIGSASFQRH